MLNRLVTNWVYGGFLAGILLLLLAPALVRSWAPVPTVAFLCLPVYMIHQYEEHDNDRFRLVLNRTVGHGRDVLSPLAVFIINVPGVWGIIWLSILLTVFINGGFALIALYLLLVNALAHIVQALRLREYNPGLVSAIVLFLPLGIYGLIEVQRSGDGTVAMHLTGLFVAIAIHAAILIHVKRQASAVQ
ncbi:MAG: HXXEE domain-containing protein [Bryobacteraceae bacterium]